MSAKKLPKGRQLFSIKNFNFLTSFYYSMPHLYIQVIALSSGYKLLNFQRKVNISY